MNAGLVRSRAGTFGWVIVALAIGCSTLAMGESKVTKPSKPSPSGDGSDKYARVRELLGEDAGVERTPTVVDEELRRIDMQHRRLEPVSVTGPLARLAIGFVVPKNVSMPSAEDAWVEMAALSGTQGRQIWRIRYGAVESVVLVLDHEERLLSKMYIADRCDLLLRDVVGDEEDEIILDRIQGTGLSTRPHVWETYRIDERGKMRLVHSFPKAFLVGAKSTTYHLWNTFDFGPHGTLNITTAIANCGVDTSSICPKQFKAGDIHSFQYDEKRGRFVATKPARR